MLKCPKCGSKETFKDETETNLYWCEKCGYGFGIRRLVGDDLERLRGSQ
jgi:transcription initiation factor TFIIIB Brf1 subunit/transcription initiation factor TFIIB